MADLAAGTIDAAELIGSTLAGRYQIESQLGKGGMAVVYQATDKSFGRKVAIKVLRTDVAKDPVAAKRLVREARAAGQLHHPNIITMHDVGESGGMVYIVMEILQGRELSDLMEEEGAVDVGRALEIGRQVASALVVAHKNGIIHRDIKPENLFLRTRGSSDFVKMLDFSIAKLPTNMVTAALTRAGSVFGTPHYMAPEQVEGRQVCPQTDIYALGAVIYELIAGEPPFDGNSVIDILLQHAKAPPPKLSATGIPMPQGLSELVDSMLAKKETDRPANASAVEEALARLIEASKRGDAPVFAAPTVKDASAAATEVLGSEEVAEIDKAARASEPRYRPTHLPPDYGPPGAPAPTGTLSAEDKARIRQSEMAKRQKDQGAPATAGMHGAGTGATAQERAAPDLDLPSDLPEAMDRGGGMRAPFQQPEPSPAEATIIGAGLAAKVRAEAQRIERERQAAPASSEPAPAKAKPRRAPRAPQRQTGSPSSKVKVNVPPPPGGRARIPSVKAPSAMRKSGIKRQQRGQDGSWDKRQRSASSTRHERPAPPTEEMDASKIPTSPGISKDEVARQHRASHETVAASRADVATMRGENTGVAGGGNQKTMLIAAIAIAAVGLISLAIAAFLFLNK